MKSKNPLNEVVKEMGWIGSDVISAVTVNYDLDLTDAILSKLESGSGSFHDIKDEIDRAIADRQTKLLYLKETLYEQLDTALRISLQEKV